MTKEPNMAANNAAASSSAPRLHGASSKVGTVCWSARPIRLHSRLVDSLQHALRPTAREFGLRKHLEDMGAEGLDIGRRHLDALALEEALRVGLGLQHALIIESLGLGLGGLDRRVLIG